MRERGERTVEQVGSARGAELIIHTPHKAAAG